MTKQTLLLLTLLLSAGLLHAQDSSGGSAKTSATPDLSQLAAAAAAKGGSSSASVQLKDPVAVVNGEKISKAELEKNFSEAAAAMNVPLGQLTADQKLQGYRQILDGMIIEKLVDKQAASVTVSKDEVQTQVDKIKKQVGSEDAFDAELKKSGLTLDQFTSNLEKTIRENKWMQSQTLGKDTVTEADAKTFYDANPKEFVHPELVQASHILFLVPKDATPAQAKAAEKKAKDAIVRANKGEPFDKLAAELSEEPGAKQRGGALGYFSKEQMVPAFADAAFAQEVGTVSTTPVKTQFGYHVIKVTDKKPAGTAPFDEAKQQIIAFLQKQKRRDAFKAVAQELRQGAKIENNLPPPAAPPMGATGAGMVPAAGQ